MFVTNWISTTKIQKISEITNFFRHYFLSRTEVEDTDADAKLVGWTIALKPNTAIQNGATITFDLNITDKWGVELPAQKVSLTVKK